jgi:hypothetical protein
MRALFGMMSSALLVTGMATFALSTPAAASTDPSNPNTQVLQGVSCTSPSSCVAVGYYSNGTTYQTLIETWNGTAWSSASSPNTSITQSNLLQGVSCTSPSSCVAVGSYSTAPTQESNETLSQTLVETWNGTAWSIAPSPNASTTRGDGLQGVSCTSPSSCVAVGDYGTGGIQQTLVETWNGTAWSIASSPNASTTFDNGLQGVSCTSPSSCVAVGDSASGTGGQTLIETWNGTAWSIASSPNTSSPQGNILQGVSCTSPSSCVAVGDYSTAYAPNLTTLIETWNGTAWSIAASPNTSSTQYNYLFGVSCTSPSSCVAVGDYFTGTNFKTLIVTWNGTAWSIASSPIASTPFNYLNGVSCTSPSSCVAVGDSSNGTSGQTLAETWNGTAWSMTDSVPPVVGYWTDAADGGIFSFGQAHFYGSMGGKTLNRPIVGMAPTSDGAGYWMDASDGGIFAFGDAKFHGSMGGLPLNKPVVGMAPTADGGGYWLVASDGGVFAFGDAKFLGSMGGTTLNKPIVGMASTPDGLGYWLVASDGGIFAFGDAKFFGSMGGTTLDEPIVGMASTPDGLGYWLVASDGGIFAFGDAKFFGSMGGKSLNKPVVGTASTPDGRGYWIDASDGGIFSFGDAIFFGSMGGKPLNAPMVGMATFTQPGWGLTP